MLLLLITKVAKVVVVVIVQITCRLGEETKRLTNWPKREERVVRRKQETLVAGKSQSIL